MKIFPLILFIFSSEVLAGTLDCPNTVIVSHPEKKNSVCCSCSHFDTSTEIKKKINDLDKKVIGNINANKLLTYQVDSVKRLTEKLEQTIWDKFSLYFDITFILFGLALGFSSFLVWREHSTLKKLIEVEEKEVKQHVNEFIDMKSQAADNLQKLENDLIKSIDSMNRRAEIELQLKCGTIDEDRMYTNIRQLAQDYRLDNLTLFKRLEKSSLINQELKDIVSVGIRKIKENIRP